jgi:phytoene dehydrogenase-like protein
MTSSLGDYLDSWFEGEALKGVLGLEGVIGNFASPYQSGTAYILLHHAFGEVEGTRWSVGNCQRRHGGELVTPWQALHERKALHWKRVHQ